MTTQPAPKQHRIIQFTEFGGPEVLQFVQVDTPSPKDDEVLIRVKAIGLNRADALYRSNQYIGVADLPACLGVEAAGTIEAVGSNVKHFRAGERVNTVPAFGEGAATIYGEFATVPAHAVVKQLEALSFEEAASLWSMFLTPYGALVDDAQLKAGEYVLISAASSSTGIAAIQVANMVGAIPIALTRTSAKRQQLLGIGAKHVIAFEEADMVEAIMTITDGKGARIAFDAVGGSLLPKLIDAMPWKCTIYSYGWLSGDTLNLSVRAQISHMLTIKGWTIVDTLFDEDKLRKGIAFIDAGLKQGKLKTVIDRVFAFNDIVEAHRYLESNNQFGKIVVTLG
jgi:NADPH:quinone reductase-like Zn-dependent oxidoreductase